jgi:hypothetical protein
MSEEDIHDPMAERKRRNQLNPSKVPVDYPRFLAGATDFGRDIATLNPLWIVKTLQQYPQYY